MHNEKSPHSDTKLDELVTARARGPKYQIYSFRGTPSQKALLDYVSESTKLSRQKILDDLVWKALEKEYGKHVLSRQEVHRDNYLQRTSAIIFNRPRLRGILLSR